MNVVADAHTEWHTVNGWDYCPLDCYAVEAYWEEEGLRAEWEEAQAQASQG